MPCQSRVRPVVRHLRPRSIVVLRRSFKISIISGMRRSPPLPRRLRGSSSSMRRSAHGMSSRRRSSCGRGRASSASPDVRARVPAEGDGPASRTGARSSAWWGAGEEINTGEAGIEEWPRALERSFPRRQVHAARSSYSHCSESTATSSPLPELHLATSIRSLRAVRSSRTSSGQRDRRRCRRCGRSGRRGRYPTIPCCMTRNLGQRTHMAARTSARQRTCRPSSFVQRRSPETPRGLCQSQDRAREVVLGTF